MLLKWSFGNEKLKRTDTVSFNLPAFRSETGFQVCPMAGVCASYCYARQGRYLMPNSKDAREFNLALVRADLAAFERFAAIDLGHIRQRTIRVHDSGDFFSQEYLDCWLRLAARFPAKRFYCYTKSIHFDWSATPPNFQRVQSTGGKMDAAIDREQPHTRVFVSGEARRLAGYVNGNQTDRPAMRGERKIGFVYHGSTRLSPAMARVIQGKRQG